MMARVPPVLVIGLIACGNCTPAAAEQLVAAA
jgi:hypothetical protein